MNAEERALLDSIHTPAFAVEFDDANTPRYAAFNKAACEITHLAVENVLGRTALEIYPTYLGQLAYNHQRETAQSLQPIWYEFTLPDSNEQQVRIHLKPMLDGDGKLIRLVGTYELITAEYVVRKAQADSMVLNSDLEQFISMAAHDLRSPIRNVRTLADMLRDGMEDKGDGKLELIDKLENVASKAMALISDVLNHAQATGSTEAVEQFELKAMCEEILTMLDPGGLLTLKASTSWLYGDKVATQITLRNLIDNALKHNKGKEIALTVEASVLGERHYQIRISDNGIGFADPAVAFLGGGTFRTDSGFGLMGVRRLIKVRGGEITAEKASTGQGAMITITLPGKVLAEIS